MPGKPSRAEYAPCPRREGFKIGGMGIRRGLLLGSRWIAGWCQQQPDQRPQQPLASGTCVVDEFEEAQVQRQGLLRDPAVGAEPRPQQRPESLRGVDMDLAESVPVVIPR